MTSTWLSYVPYHLARDILAHPEKSQVGREQRIEVVALFADISGFTPMSEALSKVGKRGAEELSQVLNAYFTPMIRLVQSYCGIIGKFAGDAMTVIFPLIETTRSDTVRRAMQCALDMQANMGLYGAIRTQTGVFGLAMKAGLAMGSLYCTTVGDPALRLEYIIAGNVLDLCADAEHHAEKGEVVVRNDLIVYAREVNIVEHRGGFTRVSGLVQRPARQPLETLPETLPDSARETLAAYLHPVIAARVRDNQIGFIREHRKVTILFVNFESFDYDDDPAVSDKLQDYVLAAFKVVEDY